jgi:hypothetical protein
VSGARRVVSIQIFLIVESMTERCPAPARGRSPRRRITAFTVIYGAAALIGYSRPDPLAAVHAAPRR